MANVDKLDGRKGRRSDSKTEIGKADNTLNFALTAGAVGLGLALLETRQAAAGTDSKSGLPDDDRKSDTSVSADQAVPSIDHSRTADHMVHENFANGGGPAVASGDEISAETAAASSSESSPETLQQASESASSLAAADDAAAGNTTHDVATVMASTDTGISASTVHTNSEGDRAFEGAHGASSVISSAIGTVASSDGALDGAGKVLEIVDDVANNLLGNGGVLDIAPVITEPAKNLVGDVLASVANTGTLVEDIVGKAGALIGSHQGLLNGLLGTGAAAAAGEVATASDSSVSTQGAASTQNIVTTGTQSHVDAGAPLNMFEEVAHSALQITEGVADAITPILAFVGQPIIEDDAHTDTDHSINVLAHHVA